MLFNILNKLIQGGRKLFRGQEQQGTLKINRETLKRVLVDRLWVSKYVLSRSDNNFMSYLSVSHPRVTAPTAQDRKNAELDIYG